MQSRNEDILRATIDGTVYDKPAQSRVEFLLLELKDAIESGGAYRNEHETERVSEAFGVLYIRGFER